MQDAYGNAQDYVAHQLDAIHATISGQEFMIPYSFPSATTALSFATSGNYTLQIWMESPRLTQRQLIATYTLTVNAGGASAVASMVIIFPSLPPPPAPPTPSLPFPRAIQMSADDCSDQSGTTWI